MIIDVIKSNGIAFKCGNCKTCFVWKPEARGICDILTAHPQCKKLGCEYYRPAEKKCPECGSDYLIEISAIVYKLMRNIRQ